MSVPKVTTTALLIAMMLSFSLHVLAERDSSAWSSKDPIDKVVEKMKADLKSQKTSEAKFRKLRSQQTYFEERKKILREQDKSRELPQLMTLQSSTKDILANLKFKKSENSQEKFVVSQESCKKTKDRILFRRSGTSTGGEFSKPVIDALELLSIVCDDADLASLPEPIED